MLVVAAAVVVVVVVVVAIVVLVAILAPVFGRSADFCAQCDNSALTIQSV